MFIEGRKNTSANSSDNRFFAMKTIILLICLCFGAMKIHAQNIDGHRTESLRNIVQRFLQQFSGAQDEESRKVHALLKENAVVPWNSNNYETTKMVGHYFEEISIIDHSWIFIFLNGNLTKITYEKSVRNESNEMLQISIVIRNEEERWHGQTPARGDNVNAGLYFIEDWNMAISKKGQKIFCIDREAYWKHRTRPTPPSDLKKLLRVDELKGSRKP